MVYIYTGKIYYKNLGDMDLDVLLERIQIAKNVNVELERLISDYMPFIKKTVNDEGLWGWDIEYDDRLSLAMLTFMNCVKQYQVERGSFMPFAAACIRNRLIDEARKQRRYSGKVIPLISDEEDALSEAMEGNVSIAIYNREQEQECLCEEISDFSEKLWEYGISFNELSRICPKQERARKQCIELGRYVVNNEEMREKLIRQRRLAQSELARVFGLSEKTIEKHRKYIVAIVIVLAGDYPIIRVFLP